MKNKILIIALLISAISTNAQTLKTYSGAYTLTDKGIEGKATYQYYEDENYNRIYHGTFSFNGGIYNDYTRKKLTNIKITGQFKNNLRTGKWIAKSSATKINKPFLSETYIANFKDGKLNVNTQIKRIDKTGGYNRIDNFSISFIDNKFSIINTKSTINGLVIEQINGKFDEEGYLDGKFLIKYLEHTRANSISELRTVPLIEDIRESTMEVRMVQIGEIFGKFELLLKSLLIIL